MKMRICSSCKKPIVDKYVCQIDKDERFFHRNCLRCDSCNTILNDACHVKDGNILCKRDYLRLCYPGPSYTCQGCFNLIDKNTDWVVKIPSCSNISSPQNQPPYNNNNSPNGSYVLYHTGCIVCHFCRKNLAPGDKYVLNRMSQSLVCMSNNCIASYNSSCSQLAPPQSYNHGMSSSPYPVNHSQGPPVSMPVVTGSGRGKRGGRGGNGCRKQNN